MPSYDKEKMLRLLEQHRRHFQVIRDLSERVQERRKDVTFKTEHMRRCAINATAEDYFERLIQLSLEDAIALPREKVEGFQREKHGLHSTTLEDCSSGISFGEWRELNHERARMARLQAEYESHSDEGNKRFACMYNLKNAIQDWGFRDPADEL